jgi:phosphatidylglycerol lysyltransferase
VSTETVTPPRTAVENYDGHPPTSATVAGRVTPPGGTSAPGGLGRLARLLGPAAVLAIVALALFALSRELRTYRLDDIRRSLNALRPASLAAALALTVCGYLVLTCYDALALRYVRRRIRARRVVFASFIAYGFSQSISLSALTGASIRYRFWSAWGLTGAEIARAIAFNVTTLWLGALTVGGAGLLFGPRAALIALPGSSVIAARVVGAALLLIVVGYLTWASVLRRPLSIRKWRFEAPSPGLAFAQVAVSALDWTLAALVLYVFLRDAAPLSFTGFLGLFICAQVLGLSSHVPGGLGVFETAMVFLLKPQVPAATVVGALVAYRAIYYLLPLAAAALLLLAHEGQRHAPRVASIAASGGRLLAPLTPDVLSGAAFAAGVILLVSGATPALPGRLADLYEVLPLAVIELAHFAASLAGVTLVLVALGLRRRLDNAYHVAVIALGVGIVASLLKGFDWEEALALAIILAALLSSRGHFYRRAALTAEPFTPGWIVAIAIVLGSVIWLGFFSYKHVEYSGDLWWAFAVSADAPRFLRATVGVVVATVAFAMAHLFRPARGRTPAPTDSALDAAARVAARSDRADAWLALTGDKALLLSDSGRAFVMYAIARRSWVALGDPMGDPTERAELAWRFRELADRHGAWTVFYQVGKENLPLYVDMGLSLVKMGEEARVPLSSFALGGGRRKNLRQTHNDAAKHGATFELVQAADVHPFLPDLRAVSDAWLGAKKTREKRFSLGAFDERYLSHFPVAVVRVDGQVVAFANVLASGTMSELSIDLMRYSPDAPRGVMDYLFVELMLWGARVGYQTFNLGMAPLSGFEIRAVAPLWSRAGALLYGYGEQFYNFRGLRQYKEKFDPMWEPRYLASPGGMALPRILANVAALISGGIGGVVGR